MNPEGSFAEPEKSYGTLIKGSKKRTCEINDSCDEFYNSIIDCAANQVKSVTLITDQDFGGGSGIACNDGIDNDGDTFTDFSATPEVGDPQCASPTDSDEAM